MYTNSEAQYPQGGNCLLASICFQNTYFVYTVYECRRIDDNFQLVPGRLQRYGYITIYNMLNNVYVV